MSAVADSNIQNLESTFVAAVELTEDAQVRLKEAGGMGGLRNGQKIMTT